MKAYVLGTIEPNKEKETIDTIEGIDGVKEVDFTHGKFDVIIKLEIESTENLKGVMLEKIRNIPGLTSTQTLIACNIWINYLFENSV